jgi:hypothetical protein
MSDTIDNEHWTTIDLYVAMVIEELKQIHEVLTPLLLIA